MRSAEQSFEGRSLRRLALSLVAALVLVLGLCPAIVLAGEVEVEPEGTVEPVAVVQGEDVIAGEPVVTVQNDFRYLKVGGSEVDTTKSVSGDHWSYEAGSNTLTLSGCNIAPLDLEAAAISYNGEKPLNIVLEGDNSVTGGSGIASEGGSFIITGKGSLNVTGTQYGIAAQMGDVTINSGTVNASGKEAGIMAMMADEMGGSVTINGGTVTVQGASSCIRSNQGVTIGTGINVKAGNSKDSAKAVDPKEFQTKYGDFKWVQTTATVAVTDVTVDPATVSIAVGDSKELKAIVTPDDAADKTVTWKSDDDDVAKVDANGKVTAVAVGRAYITATANDGSGKSGKCVVSVTPPPVTAPTVTAHVQRAGWMDSVADGGAAGTVGKSRRLEALTLKLPNSISGGIEYRCHLQKSGWEKTWKSDGQVSGTTGQSLRAEAFEIRLTGEAADIFDIRYRVHSQRLGWMGWAENGQPAGTTGMSRRAEAIQVVIVPKGSDAPGKTYNGVTQRYLQEYAKL